MLHTTKSDRWNRISAFAIGAGALAFATRTAVRLSRRIDLKGKVVVITGGSRGLGLVLARQFAQQGAIVTICARDRVEIDAAELDLRQLGAKVTGIACDLTEQKQVEDLIMQVIERHGRIDVLVNNAGLIQVGPMESMTVGDFERAMKLHFWAPLYTTLAALPFMRACRMGRIVNVASLGGKVAVPHLLPYSASKFALVGLSEGLRAELMKDGIYVTTVCPGVIRTGSHPNAQFKGRHRDEYAWFSITDSTPGVSISAERAAARIIRACRHGQAETMVSFPARLASTFHGLFPGITADLNALVNAVLPSPGGIGIESRLGRESQSPFAPSIFTALSDRAAVRNNETR